MIEGNVYHPAIHGVCGYPRPVVDLRGSSWRDERDAARDGYGRCGCGLEVRLDESTGLWVHYVSAGSPVVDLGTTDLGVATIRVGALPPTVDELDEKITMARQAHELYLEDLRRLVDEVRDLSGTDSVIELAAELERGQDVARHLDELAAAVAEASR